jgi:uncharacterized protein YjbI with pentapeptide repeats
MANERHVKLLRHDVNAWNSWRERSPENSADFSGANLAWANLMEANLAGADLRGADLSVADLEQANLSRANLSGANLSDANLSRADLSGANLSEAIITGANLSGANLSQVNLGQANLQWANLLWANLSEADLSGADVSGANLNLTNLSEALVAYTVFGDIDLSGTKGLETTYHRGPSTIGIDTIYRSKGNIPASFLRGAGVPETFINYVASLTEEDSQYCSCFISYAPQDKPFSQQLYHDLQQNGIRCWYAPESLNIGTQIRPTLDETVRVHDKLLLILSEYSVGNSWVEQEVESALAQENRHNQIILFPMRLDNAITKVKRGWLTLMEDQQHRIRDFSRWQDEKIYREKLQRLLQDLTKK